MSTKNISFNHEIKNYSNADQNGNWTSREHRDNKQILVDSSYLRASEIYASLSGNSFRRFGTTSWLLKMGDDNLSRNVCKELQLNAA
jgi:hypothetical protein